MSLEKSILTELREKTIAKTNERRKKELSPMDRYHMERLVFVITKYFNISEKALFSKGRNNRGHYIPRHLFHYLAYNRYRIRLHKISVISGRDHAAVLNSNKRINEYLSYDKKFERDVNKILVLLDKGDTYLQVQQVVDDVEPDQMDNFLNHIKKFNAA